MRNLPFITLKIPCGSLFKSIGVLPLAEVNQTLVLTECPLVSMAFAWDALFKITPLKARL
jgi:hypothetical protein